MNIYEPAIKWTGSKRSQAEYIVNQFPKNIDTYYEPFVGGASVLYRLLHTDIKVKQYVCSDKNNDLITLWNSIINNPSELVESYFQMWDELNYDSNTERRKTYFYKVREDFNTNHNPNDFLFLSRTCTNGLIRYNSKGEFNTSLHFSRQGIKPKTLKEIINKWSNKLKENQVQFICQDYNGIKPNCNDFVYFDPPYAGTKGIYYGQIDYESFWNWIRNLKCNYILSFNGKREDIDNTYNVPKDIYTKHEYIKSGRSSLKDFKDKTVQFVEESLYSK